MKEAGVGPRESAFTGHALVELKGARAVGMHSLAFNKDDANVLSCADADLGEDFRGLAAWLNEHNRS